MYVVIVIRRARTINNRLRIKHRQHEHNKEKHVKSFPGGG